MNKTECVVDYERLTVIYAMPHHSLWVPVWSYAQIYNSNLASDNSAFSLFLMLQGGPEPCIRSYELPGKKGNEILEETD